MAILKNQFRYDSTGTIYGTSKSVKPTVAKDGATFLETDTGREFRFDAKTGTWNPV